MAGSIPIKRALISVSDKQGLLPLAHGLTAAGVEIFSTGGTRSFLEAEGVPVRDVAQYTGFPEMLGGRVKTLHPKVHGGILARRDQSEDMAALDAHGIVSFELVVVNLYPFESTVARSDVTWEEAIEQIDIGGPSLIRAAAKNHAFVTVLTDVQQYAAALEQITASGMTTPELRRWLAQQAFEHTGAFDQAISSYFARQRDGESFPDRLILDVRKKAELRYGENPHQRAALYVGRHTTGANLASGQQLAGKELSYNNLMDMDSALTLVSMLDGPAAAVIKHNNPCGAAAHDSLADATRLALNGDPVSAFGCVIGFNQAVDRATAELLSEPQWFVEAMVAPDFDRDAVEILTTRPKWKANVRLVKCGPLGPPAERRELRQIVGGLLVQDADVVPDPEAEWKTVTRRQPTSSELADLRFAWAVVRHVKSNAIVLAKDRTLWGVGAGQMSRVDSVDIAIKKAAGRVTAPVLASDAFFPFADSIDQAAAAGVPAIVQPGGSRRDEEVIDACNRHSIAMIFTGRRHFKH